uniref:CSON003392 protein n=1 Tax=Culicoides sonorensis TaxID=179676 RepID=A0A336MSB7_CULSO
MRHRHQFKIIYIFLLPLIKSSLQNLDDKYLCTQKFCERYIGENGCPRVDIACRAQNSTHNGRLYDSPTPCNCCEFCLENLEKGDFCTIGTPGSPLPSKICGPGLYCTPHEGKHATCESMNEVQATPCYKEQNEFDRDRELGKIGSYRPRPRCDKDGYYEPVRCNPGQTCHCLSQDGKRIFGEAVETDSIEFWMKCECARLADTARQVIEPQFPIMTARCDPKGSYDKLQCMNDECFCTDSSGGLNGDETVNITRGLSSLPCYNKTLHRNIYEMGDYLRDCEAQALEKYIEKFKLMEKGFHVEECQPDGWYMPVRINKTNGTKYCADEYGELIEDYEIAISDAKNMNCKCARSRKLLIDAKALEIPTCDEMGNYPPATCRRGQCFCQDQDGLQTSHEVDFNDICTLNCCKNNSACGCENKFIIFKFSRNRVIKILTIRFTFKVYQEVLCPIRNVPKVQFTYLT